MKSTRDKVLEKHFELNESYKLLDNISTIKNVPYRQGAWWVGNEFSKFEKVILNEILLRESQEAVSKQENKKILSEKEAVERERNQYISSNQALNYQISLLQSQIASKDAMLREAKQHETKAADIISTLKSINENETSAVFSRLASLEKTIQASIKEEGEKHEQKYEQKFNALEENQKKLLAELKESREQILILSKELSTEKEINSKFIEKLEAKHSHDMQQVMTVLDRESEKSNNSLDAQLREAKKLDPQTVRQLIDKRQSIEDLNLIKFSEDVALKRYLNLMQEKKAVISVKSLISTIGSLDEHSDKGKVNRLKIVVDQLLQDYPELPPSAKKELKDLIKPNELLTDEAVKKQYDALRWKKETYLDDNNELRTSVTPNASKEEAIAALLNHPNNPAVELAIERFIKGFLNDKRNQLEQLSPSNTLSDEQITLRRRI